MAQGPIILKNRYQLGAKLKTELTGTIYAAVDLTTKQEVEIKRFTPALLSLPLVEKLQESLYRLASVKHPGLLIPTDSMFERKNFFTVQEPVSGEETVSDILSKIKAFNTDSALFTIKEVITALSYLHKKKICHGDVNPANICIMQDGSIVVKNTLLDAVINHAAIQKGHVLSYGSFKAPEQLQGLATRPQSDIWAAGALLYVLLTGESPFKDHARREDMLRELSVKPVLPTLRNPKVAKYIEDILMLCLRPDASKRPASTGDLLSQLESRTAHIHLNDFETLSRESVARGKKPTLAPQRQPQVRLPQKQQVYASVRQNLNKTGEFLTEVYQKTRDTVMTPELEETLQELPQALPRKIKTMAEKFDELIDGRKKRPGLFGRPKTTVQKVLVYGTMIFAVGIVAALSQTLFLGYFSSIPEIELPDLRNMPIQQAYEVLENKGLKGQTAGTLINAAVPVDHVISQKPDPGRIVKKDRIVSLYVSKGVGETKVPEVIGRDIDQARTLFARNSLGLEVIKTVYSSTVQKNFIIKQTPEPDVVIQKGTTVNVVASSGFPVTLTLKDRSAQNCMVDAYVFVPVDWKEQKVKLLLSDSRGTRTVIDQAFAPGQGRSVQLVSEETALIEVYYNDELALKQSFVELQDEKAKEEEQKANGQ